jgi:hypothetical protein
MEPDETDTLKVDVVKGEGLVKDGRHISAWFPPSSRQRA